MENKTKTNKGFISYDEYINRTEVFNRLKEQNRLIYKRNMFKIVCGGLMCAVGFVTLPLPTGSIILISVGLSLMVSGGLNLMGEYKRIKFKVLNKLRVRGLIR